MQQGDRLIDAINAAGGYLPDADSRMINHAMKLADEFVFMFLLKGKNNGNQNCPSIGTYKSDDGKVNINTADDSAAYDYYQVSDQQKRRLLFNIEMRMVFLVHQNR